MKNKLKKLIMGRKYNYLTKSKVTSGLQCHKKLWFDVHEPLKREKLFFMAVIGLEIK